MYRKSVKFFVLVLCIGLLTGCGAASSTATTPSHSQPTAATQSFHVTTQTLDKDFTLILGITPGRSGPNTFVLSVTDNHTNQPATQVNITLYTTMQDMAMGTDSLTLHAEGNGQFSATSSVLDMGGHWALGIAIQTADHIIHKAGISLEVLS